MPGKKVLVIGSGGREHALAWKLLQSAHVDRVYVAPGNGGTALIADNVPIGFTDGPKLLEFAKKNNIDLAVIGQEAASEAGVVDLFQANNLPIFGPTKEAVRIESSKAFSKEFMRKQGIPTAGFKNFNDPDEAMQYLKNRQFPQVIKADGLAAGKGVVIAHTLEEAQDAVEDIMVKRAFGESGNKVVIEDFISGHEVSIHALSDGDNYAIFPTSQDHKQIFDGDLGPNTGGMGVIAPSDLLSDKQLKAVLKDVVLPALTGMKALGSTFIGCLYPGIMVDGDNIQVLEYNARFGDPEAEVYMRLLDSDLYEALLSCAQGGLQPLKWHAGYAVSVVMASAGYPASSSNGDVINGIGQAEKLDDIVVFHAGTARYGKDLVTAGGRVLNVTATGKTRAEAIDKAYRAVALIHFEGAQYRNDIGLRN